MNAIRKVLMPLLIIPLGMFIYVFTHPDSQWESPGLESLFAVIGVPILVSNFIAWFYPEIIKAYFPVKDDWGERGDKPVKPAVVISAVVAFLCVGAGMVSAVTDIRPRSTFNEPSTLPPNAATALAHARELESTIASSSETDIVPIPSEPPQTDIPTEQASQIPETDIITEQTPQIPVSGEAAISSPTLSATQTEAESTGTVRPFGSCAPATPNELNTILQTVQDMDANNTVSAGWAVQSHGEANLWFVSAKISGPEIDANTLPGVWALLVDSTGNMDIYSINESAMENSSADGGEDREPALTMQSDGAQTAYDCAVHAK